ncbi:MAG: phospholipid carrier-dependent glycosyltransferase [Anaerolineales bacterium]|nr:phospholipid carrier-dependent glycosyltransferase [Anaerolineales bacterium]
MKTTQSRVFLSLLLIGAAYFLLFWPVNALGARDQTMISVFDPDEFAQYSHPVRMLDQPGNTLKQSIYRFTAYQHYYYGYPFYLYSAVVALLPLKLILGSGNTSYNMLLLRQLVSVLPMIAAVALLVYLQTKFQSYLRSISLFIFLLTIPAVFQNDTWWHPESLVFFFIVLTFYFLYKDNLSFGKYFYLSAIASGLAVATKLIGLFFFLAIPTYIALGWRQGRINFTNALRLSVAFVALMAVTFIVSNPFLLFASEREAAFKIQSRQSESMSDGFVLSYAKGPATWIPLITENYAQPLFLLIGFVALGIGVAQKETRLLSLLIALWAIPFTLYLLFAIAIKPKHFFIPILLPVFSTLPFLFDAIWPQFVTLKKRFVRSKGLVHGVGDSSLPTKRVAQNDRPGGCELGKMIMFLVVAIITLNQLVYNFNFDVEHYLAELNKEKNSQAIQFYEKLDQIVFSKIPADDHLVIFRDVRMYVADLPRWEVKFRWGTQDYAAIQKADADALVLWKQRLYDYTQAGAAERALDQTEFAEAARFYNDALDDNVEGYHLIYQDDFGVAYISTALYDQYFK